MFFRHLKISHTRCFLPAFIFNQNQFDEEGTEVLENKKVGGWQGVVNAFSPDEDGNPTSEVRAIISTISYSALMGGAYGSLTSSKRAYDDFFLKNQSTLFQNQFEAKSKLQSQITLAMGKGGLKWTIRTAFFCGPFTTIVTALNAYFNGVSLLSYGIAGLLVGGLARLSFGLKGFVVGSSLGAMLGIFVGCCTLLILKLAPVTMNEINQWHSDTRTERDAFFVKEQRKSIVFQYDEPPELLEHEKILQKSETVLNSKVDKA